MVSPGLSKCSPGGSDPKSLTPGTYRMQVVAFDILVSRDAATRDYAKDPPKVIAASPLMPFLVGPKIVQK